MIDNDRSDADMTNYDLIDWNCHNHLSSVDRHSRFGWSGRKRYVVFFLLIIALLAGLASYSKTGETQSSTANRNSDSTNLALARLLGFQLPVDEAHISIGTTREEVILLQGIPTIEVLKYGASYITIENNRVISWSVAPSSPLLVKEATNPTK